MSAPQWLSKQIKGVILDISGVLKDSDKAITGSLEAIAKLQALNFPYYMASNESTKTPSQLHSQLSSLGYTIPANSVLTPIPVMKEIIKERSLKPYFLVRKSVMSEFSDFEQTSDHNCVVLGDAEEEFTYENINKCFRKLVEMEKPLLFSLGMNKYYQGEDGLVLDVGAFVKALEYATGTTAINVGKPNKEYFLRALAKLKLHPDEVVMIGDDIEFDIGGAQEAGMRGVLVRTGKYRPCNDNHPSVKPDAICTNLLEVINLIIKYNPVKHS